MKTKTSLLGESTEQERRSLLDSGMNELTKREFQAELARLGYRVATDSKTFNYINRGNKIHYMAKSVFIEETDSKKHFCNVEARRDANFKTLQELRFNSFVYHCHRIWEL